MSDLVERLRDAAATAVNGTVYDYGDYWNLCDAAADEIARLRDERDAADETVVALRKELDAALDRIAHLERVQEAADLVVPIAKNASGLTPDEDRDIQAYDAIRKGEK